MNSVSNVWSNTFIHFINWLFFCALSSSLPTWQSVLLRFSPQGYFSWTLTGGIHIMYIQAARWQEMQRVRSRCVKKYCFLDTFSCNRAHLLLEQIHSISKHSKSPSKLIKQQFPTPTPVLHPTQLIPLSSS